MSDRRPLVPLPFGTRQQINSDLRSDEFAALDDNARFVIRRMVGEAYQAGFDTGWLSGQSDAENDRAIRRDAERKITDG